MNVFSVYSISSAPKINPLPLHVAHTYTLSKVRLEEDDTIIISSFCLRLIFKVNAIMIIHCVI